MSLENDGRTLVLEDGCKTCSGSGRPTDLMVVQCNASNVHGYAFSTGYINVLGKCLLEKKKYHSFLSFFFAQS